jgi:hypothetical protein
MRRGSRRYAEVQIFFDFLTEAQERLREALDFRRALKDGLKTLASRNPAAAMAAAALGALFGLDQVLEDPRTLEEELDRARAAIREKPLLLPEPEKLEYAVVRLAYETGCTKTRAEQELRRLRLARSRPPTERELLQVASFRRLPGPVQRYLRALGLAGALARAETRRPGTWQELTAGQGLLHLVGLAAVRPAQEAPDRAEAVRAVWQLHSEAFALARYGFRLRACSEGGHSWLQPPGARAALDCPLHGGPAAWMRRHRARKKRQRARRP